ncbi:MAG TPA: transcription elongation factor Spt5 [Candidatus Bathyarchaeota archaeon]|nr:transcription elongation factor Spt5 [Candidatus Bathyarchaeota archaeon]
MHHTATRCVKELGEEKSARIFTISTTVGQEKNVAKIIMGHVEVNKIPIKAILVTENLKGYIFIEADGPHVVERAVANIKHVKSRIPGTLTFSDIEKYISVKPVVEELDINDIVEVISGPFKGMRARVTDIDRAKEEITIELLEASFTLPVTVHADYVKLVSKGKER